MFFRALVIDTQKCAQKLCMLHTQLIFAHNLSPQTKNPSNSLVIITVIIISYLHSIQLVTFIQSILCAMPPCICGGLLIIGIPKKSKFNSVASNNWNKGRGQGAESKDREQGEGLGGGVKNSTRAWYG